MPMVVEASGGGGERACPARRILVIEDNEAVANALKRVLEIHHHSVAVAYDGQTGLDLAASFAPEVALIDIGLPGMDGHELARVLRTQRSIHLVAITGYGDEADPRSTADFDVYLVKPVGAARLQAALAALM